jgi:flagellar M-ring protein FliF
MDQTGSHTEQNVGAAEFEMQQIRNVWTGLEKRKQAMVVAAVAAMLLSIFLISRMAASPTMTLLYAGLENGAAGDVVKALDQRGAVYEVRGGSILVAADQRDHLRMTLASEGLPSNGGKGYELLDTLNGFGTTSQMFDAAYWRAKEGELARTIVASPHVSQARVHIANSDSNPFHRKMEVTASVSLVPSGSPITVEQANAFRFLIASAVAGMSVEDVAVIDVNGALISSSEPPGSTGTGSEKENTLRERVMRLVEARVGPGNAIVEVSLDTVSESEVIRERRFDPDNRVAISTDTEERTDSSSNSANGDVTVASNLPDGDAAQGKDSRAETSETRERVNYEVSETEREIMRSPGAVKRLTVAVLVNGLRNTASDQEPGFEPRSDEELEALRDLVSSAVGFDADRGDVITIRSMDLPQVKSSGTVVSQSFLSGMHIDVMSMIQVAVLALVTLVLGLFVVRPVLKTAAALPPPGRAVAPTLRAEEADADAQSTVLTGEIDESPSEPMEAMPMLARPGRSGSTGSNETVDRLRELIGERQEETVEILRGWLEEEQEKA